MKTNQHYNKDYFAWQKKAGEFGGQAELFKFEQFIGKDMDILEFGTGGGYMLKNIETAGKKMGIEINPYAREEARKNGIICFEQITQVEDNSVDILISNHALEHVDNPAYYLSEFKRVVKSGGRIVIVVPHERTRKVNDEDINMHLYTWSPQNMYNLCKVCGWKIESCESLCNAWMPYYSKVQHIVGWKKFHLLCKLYAKLRGIYQTRIVCVKNRE